MTGPADVRALLPRTHAAFLGGFDGLREVQARAIPAILGGRDVLVASATASGKTEAFAAPAAEIALDAGQRPATALILAPTRALANDLKRRLEAPMAAAGVTFGRYTGEHKERVGGALPSVVVATPEALDSLLARSAPALRSVRLVVIDEVHVLDGTPRGDQLRVLLHRLDLAAEVDPIRVAVSATMDDPGAFASRYLEDAELVVVGGRRRISAKAFEGKGLADMRRHLDVLADAGARKVLVFCRSRNEVERYASGLRDATRFGATVFAHHGSMAKRERERTERQFLDAAAALCFATMTLEMGIDIGSVDYVLLVGAPADVSSLLQRIGRGGRRGDATRFGYATEDPSERHIVRTMTALGAGGRLCSGPYGFRPSVLVQQALVLAGRSYIEAADLLRAVPEALWPGTDRAWAHALLVHLAEHGELERSGARRFVLAEELEQRFDRGTLHSNIGDTGGLEVVDRITGDSIGTVEPPASRSLAIGGGARRIEGSTAGRLLTDATRRAEATYFRPSMGPNVSRELAREVVESLGVPAAAFGRFQFAGRLRIVHGLGTVGAKALAMLLEGAGASIAAEDITPYSLEGRRLPTEVPPPLDGFVDGFLAKHFAWLERRTAPGPWAKAVPRDWRVASVREALGLDDLREAIARARFVDLEPDAEHVEALAGL